MTKKVDEKNQEVASTQEQGSVEANQAVGVKAAQKGKRKTAVGKLLEAMMTRKGEEKAVEKPQEVEPKESVEQIINKILEAERRDFGLELERAGQNLLPEEKARLIDELSDRLQTTYEEYISKKMVESAEDIEWKIGTVSFFMLKNGVVCNLRAEQFRRKTARFIVGADKSFSLEKRIEPFLSATLSAKDKGEFVDALAQKLQEIEKEKIWSPNRYPEHDSGLVLEELATAAIKTELSDQQMAKVAVLCAKKENSQAARDFLELKEIFGQETWQALLDDYFSESGAMFWSPKDQEPPRQEEMVAEAVGNLDSQVLEKILILQSDKVKGYWAYTRSIKRFKHVVGVALSREDLSSVFWLKLSRFFIEEIGVGDVGLIEGLLKKLDPKEKNEVIELMKSEGYDVTNSGESFEPASPAAELFERFKKGQVLSEYWYENFRSGDSRDPFVLSFEDFKKAVEEFSGRPIDEENPEEIIAFLNKNKSSISGAVREKVAEARKEAWRQGEKELSFGFGTVESLDTCLRALIRKSHPGKILARLSETEFNEICSDYPAIKKWKIENMGKDEFNYSVQRTIEDLVTRESERMVGGLEEAKNQQLATVDANQLSVMAGLESFAGSMPPGAMKQLEESFSAYRGKVIQEFDATIERLRTEESQSLGEIVNEFVVGLERFLLDPANFETIQVSEDDAGLVSLGGFQFKSIDFRDGLEPQSFAEQVLEINPPFKKDLSQLINEVLERCQK